MRRDGVRPYRVLVCLLLCLWALVLRAATSLFPYSGEDSPPQYGDYEAQRHWMEVARHVPVREWYQDSSMNNLTYWGLDYPPISGYASYVAGALVEGVDSKSVALLSSHGYETASTRVAMRVTVLLADSLFLFPASLACSLVVFRDGPTSFFGSEFEQRAMFALTLPALILMDHGHFQYNGVSLGIFLGSVISTHWDLDSLCAFLFCCSIYFKQMSLYYAPAVATFLLSRMFRMRPQAALWYSLRIGGTVALTTFVVFLPWLVPVFNPSHVLKRLFPVARGLYEDKVANVWCSLSILVKIRRFLTIQQLLVLCTVCTALGCVPFCYAVAVRPTTYQLLLSCSGCALSFFLFSFQVHEKQILLPLLPLAHLVHRNSGLARWMSLVSAFSLYPLIDREGLALAYFALLLVHCMVSTRRCYDSGPFGTVVMKKLQLLKWVSILIAVCLHVLKLWGPRIPSKPDLYVLLFTTYSCAHFCGIYGVLVVTAFHECQRYTSRKSCPIGLWSTEGAKLD